MGQEVINVSLSGGKSIFGGREQPLVARIISCDKHNECSFFKNNQCLRVNHDGVCTFGSTEKSQGYTSRAKKYGQFKNTWQVHPKYKKLSAPPEKLGVIGDIVVIPYNHLRLVETERGDIKLENPSLFQSGPYFVELNKFTTELIYRLCEFNPKTMYGNAIESYQEEVVPLFLAHLEEVMPEYYAKFVKAYPQYNKDISYIGRKAVLNTLKPSFVYYRSERYPEFDEDWYWDGKFLEYNSGRVKNFNITNDYEVVEIKLRPSDSSVVTVTSDDQVSKETVFID